MSEQSRKTFRIDAEAQEIINTYLEENPNTVKSENEAVNRIIREHPKLKRSFAEMKESNDRNRTLLKEQQERNREQESEFEKVKECFRVVGQLLFPRLRPDTDSRITEDTSWPPGTSDSK